MTGLTIPSQFMKPIGIQHSQSSQINGHIHLNEPKLEFLVQPIKRGYRFRYLSEGQSHGPLPGEVLNDTAASKKVFPSIRIANYAGPAKIILMLSTTDCSEQYLHPHSMIIDKDEKPKEFYLIDWKPGTKDIKFSNVAIMHAKKNKKALAIAIQKRMTQARCIQEYENFIKENSTAYSLDDFINKLNSLEDTQDILPDIEKEAKELTKKINLDACRLCVLAFLPDANGQFTRRLPRLYSQEIFNKTSSEGSDLKITKLSTAASVVTGNEEVWMMLDQFDGKTMDICFFEESSNWFVVVSNPEVYKKFLVIFKTPSYHDLTIQQPVQVKLQIKRRDDGSVSAPMEFTYNPKNTDPYGIEEKRRKRLHFPVDTTEETDTKRFHADDPVLPAFSSLSNVNSFSSFLLQQPPTSTGGTSYYTNLVSDNPTTSTAVDETLQPTGSSFSFSDFAQLQTIQENPLFQGFWEFFNQKQESKTDNP